MNFKTIHFKKYDYVFFIIIACSTYFMTKQVLIFHSFMELFTVIVGISLGIISIFNFEKSNYTNIIFLGLAYTFIGILDLFHMFSYPGMPLFEKAGLGLATQFWITARMLEAISLFVAITYKINIDTLKRLLKYLTMFTVFIVLIILETELFPSTYSELEGLTKFKIYSEYIISLVLLASLIMLKKRKKEFEETIYIYIFYGIIFTVISELVLTLYSDIYGVIIPLGHALKVLSFYMVFKGVVIVAIKEPYDRIHKEKMKFLKMFNESNQSIIILLESNDNFFVTTANDKAIRMLGCEIEQIVDKNLDEILEDNQGKKELLSKLRKEENIDLFDVYITSKFGKEMYSDISSTKSNIFDEEIIILNIKDVLLRKEYEKELYIYKSIVENTVESILLTDESSNILWVNESFEKLFGYSKKDVIGKKPSILKSGVQDELFYSIMYKSISESDHWAGSIIDKKRDGSLVSIHQSISKVVVGHEKTPYFFSIMSDLSDELENEAKIFNLAYVDKYTGLYNYDYIEDVIFSLRPFKILFIQIKSYYQIGGDIFREKHNMIILDLIKMITDQKINTDFYKLDDNMIIAVFNENRSEMISRTIELMNKIFNSSNEFQNISLNIVGVENSDIRLSIIDMIAKGRFAVNHLDKLGIGVYREYVHEFENLILEEEKLISDLKRALANEDIEVYYQPIVNQYTGEIIASEALARWNHKELGYIEPDRFIRIAEDNGLIIKLGYQVLYKACADFSNAAINDFELNLNVNVSIIQLQETEFIKHVEEILAVTGFPSNRLILEITESSALENFETVKFVMDKLKTINISFALDDFGTAFSSLSMLKLLPISYIKIDKSFTHDINFNLQNSLLVSAIISFSHKLGLTVIVEGVETFAQALVVQNNHCKLIQGYYYSKPVNFEEFKILLTFGFNPINDEALSYDNVLDIETEKHLFRSLRNSIKFGTFILSIDGYIKEVNQEAQIIFGYLKDELEGKYYFDLISGSNETLNKECLDSVIIKNDICEKHLQGITKNGRLIELSINSYAEFDWEHKPTSIVCLVQDITDELEVQLSLLRIREVHKKVFNESPVAIVLWDRDYSIIGWNNTSEQIFGWDISEALNMKISELMTSNRDIKWKEQIEFILSGTPTKEFMVNRTKDELQIMCEWINKPIFDDNGNVEFVLSIIENVTDLRNKELELSNMREIIIRQDRMAELGQLVAGIAHEINNPLSYMLSNSDVLESEIEMYVTYLDIIKSYLEDKIILSHEEKVKLYEDIVYWEEELTDISESFKEGLERIKEIVVNLKTFSWSGSEAKFEKYDINENIKKVLIIARNELKYSTNIKLDLDDNVPVIDSISNQINQVILNILLNGKYAIENKFINEFGVIEVCSSFDESYVYITIEDNGTGIREEHLKNIFEPFFTTKPKSIGTGLGLSISKSIIEKNHNGELSVESTFGIGTKFIIKLPINHQNTNIDDL